jgi:hypothetical protein
MFDWVGRVSLGKGSRLGACRKNVVLEVRVVTGDNVAWGVVLADVDGVFRAESLGTTERLGALPYDLGKVTYAYRVCFYKARERERDLVSCLLL